MTAHQGYLFGMDVTDPALNVSQNIEEYAWYTKTLREMMPLLTEKYGTENLQAISSECGASEMVFDSVGIKANFVNPELTMQNGVCMALKTGEEEFYLLANHCSLSFFSAASNQPNIDILLMEEGRFENESWRPGRRLNGDETVFMQYDRPVLLRVQLFVYS